MARGPRANGRARVGVESCRVAVDGAGKVFHVDDVPAAPSTAMSEELAARRGHGRGETRGVRAGAPSQLHEASIALGAPS